jgi:hypothetical protein
MLILGALLLLAQVEAGPAFEAEDSPRDPCSPLEVYSSQEKGKGAVFSATEILDLRFRAQLRKELEGPHTLQFKVYTPRGYLYQTLVVPLSVEPGAKPRSQPREVSTTLPVAGTAIVANSLYGRWTVAPYLDGKSCGRPKAFTLKQ